MPEPIQASPRRLAWASGAALLVAAIVLVAAVLPAEYGIDPLGVGRLLGLTALADAGPAAITPQDRVFKRDTIEFTLGPYQSVEYKYRMENGSSLLFSWTATRTVSYDFHSEPDGAPEGYAQSFDRQEGDARHGTYTAPFPGVHGWYWENGGGGDVTIRLVTSGFYSAAQEYFDGGIYPRELDDAGGSKGPALR